MSFLYVNEPGTNIRISEGQIIAERKDGLKTILPIEMLEGTVLFGSVQVSSNSIKELLKRGIPVTYLSSTGSFYGRMESTKHVNIERQRMQFRKGDDDKFCIMFAKEVISSKLNNQKVLLRRYNRHKKNEEVNNQIKAIEVLENSMNKATTIEQILGYEGSASRNYFKGLSLIINNEFSFKGRNKMPPKDPFNSLLSLGYTLLLYEVYTALILKGLHPYAGFIHKDRRGHPALASDMIEEWRTVVVDALVMSMIQGDMLSRDDFWEDEKSGGVFLKKDGFKKFIKNFDTKMRTEVDYLVYTDSRMSFRRALAFQAGALAKAIENEDVLIYRSIRIR
jgi:CRISPR-associated protein Cas1